MAEIGGPAGQNLAQVGDLVLPLIDVEAFGKEARAVLEQVSGFMDKTQALASVVQRTFCVFLNICNRSCFRMRGKTERKKCVKRDSFRVAVIYIYVC